LGFLRFDPTPYFEADDSWTGFVGPIEPLVPIGPAVPVGPVGIPGPATVPPATLRNEQPIWFTLTVSAAILRWRDLLPAISDAMFANIDFAMRDLPGDVLGRASRRSDGRFSLEIDHDATGVGWFVDPTPMDDFEFVPGGSRGMVAMPSTPAAGRVDLLTVLLHELGHVFGLPDLDGAAHPTSLMAETLAIGLRRAPTREDSVWTQATPSLDGFEIGETFLTHLDAPTFVVNGDFAISDPTSTNYGWKTLGSAVSPAGIGALQEDAFYNSRFTQMIKIPETATGLRFTVTAEFANNPGTVGDAFEFAMLDVHTGKPLLGTPAGLSGTDATLSLQSDGSLMAAPAVSAPSGSANGMTLQSGVATTFTIDLTSVRPGTIAAIYFDLLGFGELGTVIRIDDVGLVEKTLPSLSVSLDPGSDSGVAGDRLTRLATVDLVGATGSGLSVQLDTDGDGFDDGEVISDAAGNYKFTGVPIVEGANTFRVRATNPYGTTTEPLVVTRDSSPPQAVVNSPIANRLTASDLGYVELAWSDAGAAGLDPNSIGSDDVTVTGVSIDRVETLASGSIRYWYNDDGNTLPQGAIVITVRSGAAADYAGNVSDPVLVNFSLDSRGPAATLIDPTPATKLKTDVGYVDIAWADAGEAGFDPASLDKDDVRITGVSIDRFTVLPSGAVRYWYGDDGDKLAKGAITVTAARGATTDKLGNVSEPLNASFDFEPPQRVPVESTGSFNVNVYGRQQNRLTGVWGFYASLTNKSLSSFDGPIRLLITGLAPTGSTVVNAHGTLTDGTPYFDITNPGRLSKGMTTGAVVIGIRTPSPRVNFNFTPVVMAIPIAAGEGETASQFGSFRSVAAAFEPVAPQFRNAASPMDVNGDGRVTPLDALRVINHLDRGDDLINQELADLVGMMVSPMVDVDGSDDVTRQDAAAILEHLATLIGRDVASSSDATASELPVGLTSLNRAAFDSALLGFLDEDDEEDDEDREALERADWEDGLFGPSL
jgi:hypothetical protein